MDWSSFIMGIAPSIVVICGYLFDRNKRQKEVKKLDKEADVTGGEFTKTLLGMSKESMDRMESDVDRAYKDRDAANIRADKKHDELMIEKDKVHQLELELAEAKWNTCTRKDHECGNMRIPPRKRQNIIK